MHSTFYTFYYRLIVENFFLINLSTKIIFRWVIFEERKTEVEEFRRRVTRARALSSGSSDCSKERNRHRVFSNPFLRRGS